MDETDNVVRDVEQTEQGMNSQGEKTILKLPQNLNGLRICVQPQYLGQHKKSFSQHSDTSNL